MNRWYLDIKVLYNTIKDSLAEPQLTKFVQECSPQKSSTTPITSVSQDEPVPSVMSSAPFSELANKLGLNIINSRDYINYFYDSDVQALKNAPRILTGLSNLDQAFNGLTPGLYIIGGTPGLGKTTLIHQIAVNIAESGQPVLFFSMELSAQFLTSKELARKTLLELTNQRSALPPPSARLLNNGRVIDSNLLKFVTTAKQKALNPNIF